MQKKIRFLLSIKWAFLQLRGFNQITMFCKVIKKPFNMLKISFTKKLFMRKPLIFMHDASLMATNDTKA